MRLDEPPLLSKDVPDALFPCETEFGIPLLDVGYQADFVHLPVTTWGSVRRADKMPGTWHFYTDDSRFRALWTDPTPVVNSGCVAVVEPNFTTSEQLARACGLHRIYQKRWLARYWQSQGLRVFVDLNVAVPFALDNLRGVPRGWRSYMTRGYADRMGATCFEYEIACTHAGTENILFAVYGGGSEVRALCADQGWWHIPEIRTQWREQKCRNQESPDTVFDAFTPTGVRVYKQAKNKAISKAAESKRAARSPSAVAAGNQRAGEQHHG